MVLDGTVASLDQPGTLHVQCTCLYGREKRDCLGLWLESVVHHGCGATGQRNPSQHITRCTCSRCVVCCVVIKHESEAFLTQQEVTGQAAAVFCAARELEVQQESTSEFEFLPLKDMSSAGMSY